MDGIGKNLSVNYDVFILEIVELHPLHGHDLIALRKMKDENNDPSYFCSSKRVHVLMCSTADT